MTLTAAAMGFTAIGSFVSAIGTIQAGNAQADADNRNALIAERNKQEADRDRQLAIETARIEAEDKSRENRRNLAAIRAAYGASGFEFTGSPLEVLADTSIEQALDTRRIEYEGKARSREGALKMLGYQDDADMFRASAKNAKKASRISAGASLLSGASQTARIGANA